MLNEALLGGTDADELIEQADSCRLPSPRMEVLRGLQAFYAGRLKEANERLKLAEPSVAAQALRAWVSSVAGDNNQFAPTASRLLDSQPESPEDYLLLGQLHSMVVPRRSLNLTEKGMKHRESSVLAHTIHAVALANAGTESADWDSVNRAVCEVKAARVFKPNNTFVLSSYLHVHHLAYRAARRRGDEQIAAALLAEGERAAGQRSREAVACEPHSSGHLTFATHRSS